MRPSVITLIGLVFVFVIAVSVAIGFVGAPERGDFDWELFAVALTGLGTLTLAVATGLLALSTWTDVRASQRVAEAAVEANELVRAEQDRRPRLTLEAD